MEKKQESITITLDSELLDCFKRRVLKGESTVEEWITDEVREIIEDECLNTMSPTEVLARMILLPMIVLKYSTKYSSDQNEHKDDKGSDKNGRSENNNNS